MSEQKCSDIYLYFQIIFYHSQNTLNNDEKPGICFSPCYENKTQSLRGGISFNVPFS